MTQTAPKKSDLGVRTLSAIVMIAVAGGALWAGGWWWMAFVAAVGLGVLWEWWALVRVFRPHATGRALWLLLGIAYIGVGCSFLALSHGQFEGVGTVLSIIAAVIFTDVGAYFAGRGIGGPKIAPRISPSKTWAGLVGGMLGASLALGMVAFSWANGLCGVFYPSAGDFGFDGPCSGVVTLLPPRDVLTWALVSGAILAVVAQAGDFFESWMKRSAGVKDSGRLIPGHGGLFDRVDGLIAVCFVLGVIALWSVAL